MILSRNSYSSDDLFVDIMAYTLILFFTIIFIYPVIYTVALSFSSPEYVNRGEVWLIPRGINFRSYKLILEHEYIMGSFLNSVIYTSLGTLYSMILTIFGAYALAHERLRGRNFFSLLIAFTMLFSGGMIPTYLLVKDLKMLDTIWALIIPLAVSPYNMIVMRTVFQQNPSSLEESAKIDGAGYFLILFKIIIPISKPVIATIALFYAVGKWNDFFTPLIYLNTKTKFPLQLIARELLVTFSDQSLNRAVNAADQADRYNFSPMTFRAAVIFVCIFPLLVIYPFVQKYFVKGIMIGAVKG